MTTTEDNLPRYAIYREKRVRVLGYRDGRFIILTQGDIQTSVTRDKLTFVKPRRQS